MCHVGPRLPASADPSANEGGTAEGHGSKRWVYSSRNSWLWSHYAVPAVYVTFKGSPVCVTIKMRHTQYNVFTERVAQSKFYSLYRIQA
jgi:hypothetical protein